MNKIHTGWYLIYTRPRHEKKVYTSLTEKNITTFLPVRKVLREWHDRKKFIDEPLFPSYVFVYLENMRNYYDGINTDGSLYYVKSGKEIARVDETVVDSIRLVADRPKDIEVSDNYFKPGQQLLINKGALTGLACEVVNMDSKTKLLVRVDLLRRNLLLSMSEDYLLLQKEI